MKIFLIRHGETEWNAVGRLQGREDIPLNEIGKTQAINCGKALMNRRFAAVISSTLSRANQTAEIIAGILGINVIHRDFDLVERDYGKASGLTAEERALQFPDGKYEGYENSEALLERIFGALHKWADGLYPNDIGIVSHGGAINAVLREFSINDFGLGKKRLKNACINCLSYDGKNFTVDYYDKSYDEI